MSKTLLESILIIVSYCAVQKELVTERGFPKAIKVGGGEFEAAE